MVEHHLYKSSRVDKRIALGAMEPSRKKSTLIIKSTEVRVKLKTDKSEIVTERRDSKDVQIVAISQSVSPNPHVETHSSVLQRTFGKVVISLENCILPADKLFPTPSMTEGLDVRTEWYLRRLGCDIIQHAGILLKLPQTAAATAQVLYQRFYYAKSFIKNDYLTMGMACVYLSSKVEESPRRLRDIINVFTHIRQTLCGEPIEPVLVIESYVNLKNQVIKCERRLLKELGFCVHVKHPHKLIVMYLQLLDMDKNAVFVQKAWNYMNDSLRTDLFVRYSPEAVACGCIFLAARALQIPLPRKTSWFQLLAVTADALVDIATNILLLYSIKLPPIADILEKVDALRAAVADTRAKGPLAGVVGQEDDKTPDSTHISPEVRPREYNRKDDRRNSRDERRSRDHEHRRQRSRSNERKEKKRRRSRSPRQTISRDRKSPRHSSPHRRKVRGDDRQPGRRRSPDVVKDGRRRSRSRSVDYRSSRDYDRRH
ncbi:cyclin-L1-like [Paramacrobiotus metropolitanus]|uniref:cyclin-L1-like n=1 Tax=Paramacrobiotus metropolitanus TaxID=2943436 RepID=UPI002445D899|nr:cyclin-L1-like [Paramacrobiotus metropolitanus]